MRGDLDPSLQGGGEMEDEWLDDDARTMIELLRAWESRSATKRCATGCGGDRSGGARGCVTR